MTMDGVLRLYFGESQSAHARSTSSRPRIAPWQDGYTFYTENAGLPTLRRAIADNYCRLHGVELDPAGEIVVTASGVQALNLGIRCALDPGDEAHGAHAGVAQRIFEHHDGERHGAPDSAPAVRRPLHAWISTALEAAVTPRTRLLLYTSPSNPLGWVATGRGTTGPARFRAPSRTLADGGRSLRPPVLRRRRSWASPCPPFCARPRATMR